MKEKAISLLKSIGAKALILMILTSGITWMVRGYFCDAQIAIAKYESRKEYKKAVSEMAIKTGQVKCVQLLK